MADRDAERRIVAVARRQAGAWSRGQALECRVGDGLIRVRRQQGAWASPESGVFVAASAPSSLLRSCWVAHLAAGLASVVSHEAAATLWGLSIDKPRVVVTMPHGYHPRLRLATVCQSRDLDTSMVRQLAGLALTNPARTILDLAAVLSVDALGRLLAEATTLQVVRLAEVQSLAHQLSFSGRPGMGRVARVLDERGPGNTPPASELERMFQRLVRAAGLPEGKGQAALRGRDGRAHVVDACMKPRW